MLPSTGSLKLEIGHIHNHWGEIEPYFHQHGLEAKVKNRPLNIDKDRYFACSKAGRLVFVMAKVDNRIIGYLTIFLSTHLHYKDLKIAAFDVYYVQEEYRKYGVAIRLFRFAEKFLKELGCDEIVATSKTRYDKIFEKLGWIKTDHVFTKELTCATP